MSDFQQSPLNQNNPWNGNAQAWNQGGYGLGFNLPFGAQQGWGHGFGHLGQAAFGQQNYGGLGGWSQGQGFGNPWQRQLSQQDVGEIVRQLVPYLPQVVAQAQQPQAAFGYGGGFGGQGGFGSGLNSGLNQGQRHLSQQDVNEVVRQILPVIPQIVSLLHSQQQQPWANAIYGGNQGGHGAQGGYGNQGFGWNQGNQQGWGQGSNLNNLYGNQNPYGQNPYGQNSPFGQAAFGGGYGQRQLNQAEVGEVVRQLTAALPQVIANLQSLNQNQHQNQQRAA